MEFQYSPPPNAPVSSEELIQDLQTVAKNLNTEKLSQSAYSKYGKFGASTIKKRFGTWNNALTRADLKFAKINFHTNERLFENILNIWQKKGSQPRQSDIDSNTSEIKSGVYKKRFGSWGAAMKNFIEYANSIEVKKNQDVEAIKKTKRDPSLRIRYKVLKRDNFSCVKCGASPAKNPAVELHIDHIRAWSNGGETEISNLQTLCMNCNLGKSNLE